MAARPRSHSHGATLVELVMTITVVSVALAGVLTVINFNSRASADPMVEHQTIAIAEAYLEEILTKDFTHAVESGESRTTYDDVYDYNGLADSGAHDQNNNPISGLESYAVSVQVTSEALGGIVAANVWRVQVTVTPPHGDAITISGYRTNY